MKSKEDFITFEKECPKCINNKKVKQIKNDLIYNMSDIVCDEKDTICKECGFYYSKYTIIQTKQ